MSPCEFKQREIELEEKISKNLVDTWNYFTQLEMTHPSHAQLFVEGIHSCQQVIMWRESQRYNPKKYPIILK
jgi:hypothetical protein